MPQVQDTALWFFRAALGRVGGHLTELEMEWLASRGFAQGDINSRWAAFAAAGNTPPVSIRQLISAPSLSKTSLVAGVSYIFDTDLDSDCDDVSALALLFGLTPDVVAVTTASNNTKAAPCARVLLDYAGLTSVPVGAYQGTAIGGGSTSLYTSGVVSAFAVNPADVRSNYTEAVTVLRTALAAAPDASVKLIVVGTCTNIAALLASPADGISALDGVALVAAKCISIHVMGGHFTSSSTSENNILYDIAAANSVASTSPVPVYWAGAEVGATILTEIATDHDPLQDPFKKAWDLAAALLTDNTRPSWDLAAVLNAVQGTAGVFSITGPGNVSFADPSSFTTFTADAGGKNYYLVKTASDAAIAAIMDTTIDAYLNSRDTYPPTITSSDSKSATEGTVVAFTLTASETSTWSIVAGLDSSDFSIATDQLTFTADPYVPAGDNTRSVTVRATDLRGNTSDQIVTVTILDDAGYSYVNSEAATYVSRMAVEPDNARKLAVDNFFTAIKAIGLSKFAGMMLIGHTEQASLLDVVRTSTSWTNTGSSFVTDRYLETDGVDDYIDSGYNPTGGGGVYAQNSAHFAYWNVLNTVISHGSAWGGANDDGGVPNTQLAPRGSTGNFTYRINDATTGTLGSQTINIGLAAVNRKAASGTDAREIFRDGTKLQGTTTASTALPDAPIWLGRVATVYSNRRWVFSCLGSSLTNAEHTSLYNAVSAYLTAIGAI